MQHSSERFDSMDGRITRLARELLVYILAPLGMLVLAIELLVGGVSWAGVGMVAGAIGVLTAFALAWEWIDYRHELKWERFWRKRGVGQ